MLWQVFRIEHPDTGTGPYRGPKYFSHHRHAKSRPTIWGEYDVLMRDKWEVGSPECRFGFADLNDLLDWFEPPDLEDLRTLGFVITVYEVPSDNVVFWGEQSGQVVFRITAAEKLFTMEC